MYDRETKKWLSEDRLSIVNTFDTSSNFNAHVPKKQRYLATAAATIDSNEGEKKKTQPKSVDKLSYAT